MDGIQRKNFEDEIIFVRGKLNATGCEEMLCDNLILIICLSFVTEIEDEKAGIRAEFPSAAALKTK